MLRSSRIRFSFVLLGLFVLSACGGGGGGNSGSPYPEIAVNSLVITYQEIGPVFIGQLMVNIVIAMNNPANFVFGFMLDV